MTLEQLTIALDGQVLLPGDEGYADASRTFMAVGTPAVVVRPGDPAEVATAVRHAARTGEALSVRSGGHSALGFGTHDEGMVIDLSRLDEVAVVDRAARRVRVGGGATWGRVASVLKPYGLGLTAGDTKGVGVGGLTLGGGIGWMVRKHGLAVDSLVAADVVTADGRILRASEEEHPDLFWALRGGGGNFGVVVGFEFLAQEVSTVHFGTISYQLDDVGRLLTGWRDHMRVVDEALSSTIMVLPEMFGHPPGAMVLACYAGDDENAMSAAVDPLLQLGAVTHSAITPTPYADILEDPPHPEGIRMVASNTLVPQISDELVDLLASSFGADSPSVLSVRSLGGAMARVHPEATAFAHRDAEAMVVSGTMFPEDAPDAALEEAFAAWRPIAAHGTGAYVNFLGTATDEDVRMAYPAPTYVRLAAVKQAYDPGNLFNRNHNIVPAP